MKSGKIILTLLCLIALNTRSHAQQIVLKKIWTTDTTLRTPESVYFHAASNNLFVTNIDGQPWAKDGQGFISILTPGGRITLLKWVEGLNSPKGMGVVGNTMYVADMDELIIIDIKQGTITKREKLEGAEQLNDVTVGADGTVYVSDSQTKRVFRYSNGKAEVYADGLNRPNGVLWQADGLLILDADGMHQLQADKSRKLVATLGKSPDGLVKIKEHSYIASCWPGEVFHVDTRSGTATKILDTQAAKLQTADIGYDPSNKILFVPTFFGNTVTAYRVETGR